MPESAGTVRDYRLEVGYVNGEPQLQDDPYRHLPTLGEIDLHLIGEGRHEQLWRALGARPSARPAPRSPSGRRTRAGSGSSATSTSGTGGRTRCGRSAAPGCGSCSCPASRPAPRTSTPSAGPTGCGGTRPTRWRPTPRRRPPPRRWCTSPHTWADGEWLAERAGRQPLTSPMSVYEVHLGSWRPGLSYRELAVELAAYVHRPGVHPRRVPAGGRASVRRLVGVPGHLVLRADVAVRRAGRLQVPRRHAAPGGHRRHRRLGARALPARLLGAGRVRRHPPVRALRSAARLATGLGHARVQLRPLRGEELPRRQRHLLARGVPHRRAAGRRGRVDALPGLLAQGGRVGAQRARRPGEPATRSRSCRRSTPPATSGCPGS